MLNFGKNKKISFLSALLLQQNMLMWLTLLFQILTFSLLLILELTFKKFVSTGQRFNFRVRILLRSMDLCLQLVHMTSSQNLSHLSFLFSNAIQLAPNAQHLIKFLRLEFALNVKKTLFWLELSVIILLISFH